MARLNVAAAGNAETNANLINARFQAEALRRLRGNDCGVLDNSFYSSADGTGLSRTANSNFMWPLTATNVQNITVGRGMATAYGYDIQSEEDISFTGTAPSGGVKYLFIYLEWDLSNPVEAVGSLLLQDNGASASWTPPYQDNLITNPIGKYQMPLYRLTVDTAGVVTGTQNWTALGVKAIGNPLRAEYATRANDSDRADYPSGDQSGKTIAEQFSAITGRLDALGFRQAAFSIAGIGGQSVLRQGNYVKLQVNAPVRPSLSWYQEYFAEGKIICTLPELYRPSATVTAALCVTRNDHLAIAAWSVSIGTDGQVKRIDGTGADVVNQDATLIFCVGYEAPAIPV